MPDKSKKFHEFALKSILFKGQHDLYFCYIKSEKIAHVLSILQGRSMAGDAAQMESLVSGASRLPETIAHFAAGEIELAVVLADLFSLLSAVRLSSTQNFIHKENALLISDEYEALAQRLTGGGRLSPFVTSEDFLLPSVSEEEDHSALSLESASTSPHLSARRGTNEPLHVKDSKGQHKEMAANKGHSTQNYPKGDNKRTSIVLGFVRKHAGSSIKDISKVIKDCSEKTIQRELSLLIEQGFIEKRGERRWSVYYPVV
jgi:hypothetical protein